MVELISNYFGGSLGQNLAFKTVTCFQFFNLCSTVYHNYPTGKVMIVNLGRAILAKGHPGPCGSTGKTMLALIWV